MLEDEKPKGKFSPTELAGMIADNQTRLANAEEELAAMKAAQWGWTSYKKTLWRSPDDVPLYEAYFMRDFGPKFGYEKCRVQIWARRPTLALREICKGEKHPSEYARTVVN
jgi:hypothetical protein